MLAAHFDLSTIPGRLRSNEELVRLLFDVQAALKPSVFVEVGAFDARFSREARAQHPNARVVAFEGNPYNHEAWTAAVDYAALGVEYLHTLVSDQNGFCDMLIERRRGGLDRPKVKGSDSMMTRTDTTAEYETRKIPSVRLDDFFGGDPASYCLWIDVEGATEKVFLGAEKTLTQTNSILIEVEEYPYWSGQWLFDDVESFLSARGFFPIARDFQDAHQFNVLFLSNAAYANYIVRARLVEYFNRLRS